MTNLPAPFENDLFSRETNFQNLKKKIDKCMNQGGAIVVDAPWGMGKTWFADNSKRKLDQERKLTHLIDASLDDHIQGPFECLLLEITYAISKNDKDKKEKWIKILTPFLETLNVLQRSKTNINFKEIINFFVEKNYSLREELGKLKESLKEFINPDNPFIIFVDELDRCNPPFAIKFIECLKYFFEIPGLVFVLTINYEQLKHDVRHVYGEHINSHSYLEKYFKDYMRLEKDVSFFENKFNQVCKDLKIKLDHRWIPILSKISCPGEANFRQSNNILDNAISCHEIIQSRYSSTLPNYFNPGINFVFSLYLAYILVVDDDWVKKILSNNLETENIALKQADNLFAKLHLEEKAKELFKRVLSENKLRQEIKNIVDAYKK